MLRRKCVLLAGATAFMCGLFFLYHTGGYPSYTQLTQSDHEHLNQWRTARLSGLGSRDDVQRLRERFFIIDPSYKIHTKPAYFHDLEVSLYQATTYYIAAELARRYKVKHIIDIGCGKSYKLAKLHPNFTPIGIDFLDNVKYSRAKYPHLRFIEINMEGGNKSQTCHVNIEDSVVKDSVVLSADVVEHIRDPVSCYLKLLRDLARNTKAVVFSTPDRGDSYTIGNGPPTNDHHVREWSLKELEFLLIDNGLFPVIGGRGCNRFLLCNYESFLPDKHKLGNAILTMRNGRVGEQWAAGTVPDVKGKFLAFVVLRKSVQPALITANVLHLFSQGVDKVFLLIDDSTLDVRGSTSSSLSSYLSQGRVKIFQLEGNKETALPGIIAKISTASDWSILTDANEFVQPIRDASVGYPTLRRIVSLAQLEKFNAVAVTTIFADPSREKTLIKIYSEGAWNKDNNMTFTRHVDVMRNRVRIWLGNPQLRLETLSTKAGHSASTGVNFTGMSVYPYGVYGERVSPDKQKPDALLKDDRMQKLFAYHLSLQFMLTDDQQILQKASYDF